MTEQKPQEKIDDLSNRAKGLVNKGNQRHIVVRKADGEKIFEFSVTVGIIAAFVLIFLMPGWGWLLAIGVAIYATVKKIRVELVRDLSDEDDVVQVDLEE